MQFTIFDPFGLFGLFNTFFIIVPIFMVVIFVIIFVTICKAGSQAARGIVVDVPRLAIPEQYRGATRPDGTEIRTVRLPERCSKCGAAIASEGIDWVGPLEAKCNYCGGTVRAQLERV
ncbi:MAG: hypothetical protein C4K47_09300 [Candidatus Thorarchaeota archaeon]|nr:MAG: hypothetical protein C4K47_09300 [Candidatus Thorarchaeota archaeon]